MPCFRRNATSLCVEYGQIPADIVAKRAKAKAEETDRLAAERREKELVEGQTLMVPVVVVTRPLRPPTRFRSASQLLLAPKQKMARRRRR